MHVPAVDQDADEKAHRIGNRPEDMVAHGVVVLDPSFVSVVEV